MVYAQSGSIMAHNKPKSMGTFAICHSGTHTIK